MAARPLRVLILEDRPEDADLALHELRRSGYELNWRRVEDEAGFKANLDPELDLILADYHQPHFDALRALKLMQQAGLDIPFVIVSGAIGEETAVAAVRQGAIDYVLKDRLARLGTAVENAVERPLIADGHALEVMACIGIAVFPQHGSTSEALLQRADVALYAAKRTGNSYSIYRPEDDPYDASRLVVRADLRRAIEQHEIVLY